MSGISPGISIALDFIAWFIIHMSCALLAFKLPDKYFEKDNWIYKPRSWERSGRIWQSVFRVRSWKNYLPDGSAFFKKGFKKKHLESRDSEYIKTFILESRRGELTHWLAILPAPLFFIWNPLGVSFFMIIYALLINMPCIIAQRYNRPRFSAVLKLLEK